MTNLNTVQATGFNPNFNMNNSYSMQTSMANDFFGAQAFGGGFQVNPAQQVSFLGQGNGSLASNILQEYCLSQGGCGMTSAGLRTPTMQDYYMASQVANMFANNTPLLSSTTSFTNTDLFAQQVFNPPYQQRLSYSA